MEKRHSQAQLTQHSQASGGHRCHCDMSQIKAPPIQHRNMGMKMLALTPLQTREIGLRTLS